MTNQTTDVENAKKDLEVADALTRLRNGTGAMPGDFEKVIEKGFIEQILLNTPTILSQNEIIADDAMNKIKSAYTLKSYFDYVEEAGKNAGEFLAGGDE